MDELTHVRVQGLCSLAVVRQVSCQKLQCSLESVCLVLLRFGKDMTNQTEESKIIIYNCYKQIRLSILLWHIWFAKQFNQSMEEFGIQSYHWPFLTFVQPLIVRMLGMWVACNHYIPVFAPAWNSACHRVALTQDKAPGILRISTCIVRQNKKKVSIKITQNSSGLIQCPVFLEYQC